MAEKTTSDLFEESMSLTKKSCDLIHIYFVTGLIFNSNKRTLNSKINKLKTISPDLHNIYEKGVELLKSYSSEKIVCLKCNKEIVKEEDLKFCSFCGEKLSYLLFL